MYIPNAVSIANIITENFLKNNSKIEKINLDSEISNNDGRMISNIEIIRIEKLKDASRALYKHVFTFLTDCLVNIRF